MTLTQKDDELIALLRLDTRKPVASLARKPGQVGLIAAVPEIGSAVILPTKLDRR
jgi:hypothetical protein